MIRLILAETKIKKISFGSLGWEIIDEEFIGLYRDSLVELDSQDRWVQQQIATRFSKRRRINSNFSIKSLAPANLRKRSRIYCLASDYQSNLVNSRLSPHFHLPLQSGCKATLKRMKRPYSTEDCQLKIVNLKKHLPGFSFSTDIIVGFPGETKKEFQQTLKFLQSLKSLLKEKARE